MKMKILADFQICISVPLNNTLLGNDFLKFKEQCLEYSRTNIIGYLKINSVRNKFDSLIEIIKNLNIFFISESKLDAWFPKNQFKIKNYKCFRHGRSKYDGGLMFHSCEGIPCNILTNLTVSLNVEMVAIGFHQVNHKPPTKMIQNLLKELLELSVIIYLLMKIFFYWVISIWPREIYILIVLYKLPI